MVNKNQYSRWFVSMKQKLGPKGSSCKQKWCEYWIDGWWMLIAYTLYPSHCQMFFTSKFPPWISSSQLGKTKTSRYVAAQVRDSFSGMAMGIFFLGGEYVCVVLGGSCLNSGFSNFAGVFHCEAKLVDSFSVDLRLVNQVATLSTWVHRMVGWQTGRILFLATYGCFQK